MFGFEWRVKGGGCKVGWGGEVEAYPLGFCQVFGAALALRVCGVKSAGGAEHSL